MSQQSAPENENKRKRLTQACELCRRKKIKCDGAKPGCGNCLKLNINCTYSTSNKKRGPRQGYIEMLEQRLAKMEKILLSADKQNDSEMDPIAEHQEYDERDSHMSEELYHQDSNSVVESNAISSSTLSPASYSKSSNSNNDTMLSNINTNDTKSTNTVAAGSKRLSEDILEMAESPKSLSSISNSLPSPKSHIFNQRQSVHRETKNDVLPSPAIIDHCIDLFFKYLYSTIPIFDKDILKTQIAQKKRSDFFILCLLAATARFSDSPDVAKNPPWYAGEKYAEKARPSIIKILDEPSISNTQALLLLSMHEYGCGRGPRSWMYTGMAMRMAMELGLHDEVDDSEECSDSDMSKSWSREYRRRLLWSLYCLDKISSAATGKPPCLSSVYCNVFLPSSDDFKMDQYYAENLDGSRYIISNRSGLQDSQLLSAGSLTSDAPINENSNMSRKPPLSAFAYFVRIADLLGKVTTYVNSKKADSSSFVPPCSPDSEFQQLDRAIDIWYDELPIHLKNTPANFEMYRKSAETNESRLFTILHVVHNALIVLLHRPSLVASDTLYCHLIQPSIKQFITNSVEKCMAAVDNVTILLKEIGKRKESIVPFLTYFAYTVATVVVSNSFSPRKEEAQKAKQALGVYFQLLLTARGLWAMADKLYFMIQDLYSIHSNVLKRQQLDNLHVDNASPLSSVRSSQQPTLQPFQQQESFSYPVQPLPLQQQQQPQEANQAPSVDNALADWTLPYYINALSVPTSSNPENGDTSSLFQIPQAFNEPFLYDNMYQPANPPNTQQSYYPPPPNNTQQNYYPPPPTNNYNQPQYHTNNNNLEYGQPPPPNYGGPSHTPEQASYGTPAEKSKLPSGWNDIWAAILWICNFGAFIGLAVVALRTYSSHKGSYGGVQSENAYPGLTFDTDTIKIFGFSSIVGFGISFIYLIIANMFPRPLIYITFIGSIIVYFGVTIYYFVAHYYSAAIIFLIFSVLYVFCFYWWRSRIPFATVMLQTITNITRKYPTTMVVGIISLVVQTAFSFFFLFTVVGIYQAWYSSSGNNSKLNCAMVFLVFSFYWTSQVITYVTHVTLAGLFATVYFLNDGIRHPIWGSARRALTTSFGSICFGALLIALINLVRYFLQIARANTDNACMAFFICIIQCIVNCFAGLFEWFNYYAFSGVAIYGKAFVPTARRTWTLIKDRGIEAMINDNIIGNVLFMGGLLVGVLCGLLGYIYLKIAQPSYNQNGGMTPVIVMVCFLIGSSMFSTIATVISSGVATTFVCLAEDPDALRRSQPELYEQVRNTWPRVAQGV